MAAILAWLKGKKTYILVVLGALTILVQFAAGDVSFMQFISSDAFLNLLELLGLGTIRAGVSKING